MSEDNSRYFISSVEETKAILDALTCSYRVAVSELCDRSLTVKDIKVQMSFEIVPLNIDDLDLEDGIGLSKITIVEFIKNCYNASDNLNN